MIKLGYKGFVCLVLKLSFSPTRHLVPLPQQHMMNPFVDIPICLFPNTKVPKEATLIRPREGVEWLDLVKQEFGLVPPLPSASLKLPHLHPNKGEKIVFSKYINWYIQT